MSVRGCGHAVVVAGMAAVVVAVGVAGIADDAAAESAAVTAVYAVAAVVWHRHKPILPQLNILWMLIRVLVKLPV